MSLLTIRVLGDPVLRRKAKPVLRMTGTERKELDDLTETMLHADGIGLAAPQVGIAKRMLVVRASDDKVLQLINPEIVHRSEESIIGTEACLSLPGFQAEVERYFRVHIEGRDRHWNTVELELEDFPARVIQHEIDHLDGRLFIDGMVPDTLNAVSCEEDPETGEENTILTPVSLADLRAHFARNIRPPSRRR